MEKSGFFNSINGDRRYKADFFAEYFATFIGNGVFPNPSTNLQIISNNNMTVTIKPGRAWINGYYYANTDDLIIPIEVADGILNRIDRIALRHDTIKREIKFIIKKGQFASSPVAPILQRDADAYEIALADIKVNKGAISITQSDITDLRLNNNLCGIVHGTVDQVDTTTIFNQYLDWYKRTTSKYELAINNSRTQLESDFNTWFNSIKDILSGDVAGNLLNLINEHRDNKNNPHEVTVEQIGAVSKKEFESHLADIGKEIGDINDASLPVELKGKSLQEQNKVLFQSASDGKTKIANATTGKGQVASKSDSWDILANKISNIKTGYSIGDYLNSDKLLPNKLSIDTANTNPKMIFDYNYHFGTGYKELNHYCDGERIFLQTNYNEINLYNLRTKTSHSINYFGKAEYFDKICKLKPYKEFLYIHAIYNYHTYIVKTNYITSTIISKFETDGNLNDFDIDSEGNIYCLITKNDNTTIIKYNSSFSKILDINSTGNKIYINTNDNIYINSSYYEASMNKHHIVSCNKLLQPLNILDFEAEASANVLIHVNDDSLYIYYESNLYKYDKNLKLIFTKKIENICCIRTDYYIKNKIWFCTYEKYRNTLHCMDSNGNIDIFSNFTFELNTDYFKEAFLGTNISIKNGSFDDIIVEPKSNSIIVVDYVNMNKFSNLINIIDYKIV